MAKQRSTVPPKGFCSRCGESGRVQLYEERCSENCCPPALHRLCAVCFIVLVSGVRRGLAS
jgi:hypothetical protein